MSKLKSTLVNICRFLLALTFIFSGFVKAIDPLGSQYKIGDYLTALGMAGKIPDWVQLMMSISLSGAEFTIGILLLLAIRRLWRCHTSDKQSDLCEEFGAARCGCCRYAVATLSSSFHLENQPVDSYLLHDDIHCCSIIVKSLPFTFVRFSSLLYRSEHSERNADTQRCEANQI